MTPSILLAAAAAGFVYGITPGPGVLAVLGIGADQGRRAGAAFLGGHLVGDVVWATVALAAIIGVHAIGPVVFDALGLVSGLYLFWLGLRAVTARRRADGDERRRARIRRPLAHGVVFGLTNPKAYPVAVATFTALLSARAGELSWGMLPWLVLASLIGGLLAYAILVATVGAAAVRRAYRRHETLVTRLSGVLFIGFALNALIHAAPGLAGSHRPRLPRPDTVALLVLCALAGGLLAPGRAARAAEPSSPAAYCARVGTDDTVHPLPPSLLPAAEKAFGLRVPPDIGAAGVSWRCADGKALACFIGANLPCGKADTSTTSQPANEWCAKHPGAGIPLVVVGHDTVWHWRCDGTAAVRDGAAWQLDSRGFVKGLWVPLAGPA